MKGSSALLAALSSAAVYAVAVPEPVVDETYPYTGPAVPIGDWVDNTVNGNGKGFPRLSMPPAVKPASANPSNNINVVSTSYTPGGINIHYQTAFGLGASPSVQWGSSASDLSNTASGVTKSYDRTPPCSLVTDKTQCNQFFHDVSITGLSPDTTYYYKITAANGTTASDVLSFTTTVAAGTSKQFSVAILNDMGFTNALGTYTQLLKAATDKEISFAWHGGDISYADDWYSGILACEASWDICYNGTSSELPGGIIDDTAYLTPVPEGEIPNQGGPLGGDISTIYETNWDLWQQWLNNITTLLPYMVLPGNHEASCGEFDGPGNSLTAYLNLNETNSTTSKTDLTYYSCPPSQRNFTAYQNRFTMPGDVTGGVGNFWYSFDFGLVHFISLNGETDYAYSPEWPFVRDLSTGETHPAESETFITDSGPFGTIDGSWTVNSVYQQYKWLEADLAAIDREKTPWVVAMSHRPMYSSEVSSYEANVRDAFQGLLINASVDVYMSGHIHWFERMFPLTANGVVDQASVKDNSTYYANGGVSMTHIVNGAAGNIESHSILDDGEVQLNTTAYLDQTNYGFTKMTVFNETAIKFEYVHGSDGSIGDEVTILKRTNSTGSSSSSSSSTSSSSSATGKATGSASATSTSTSASTHSASSSSLSTVYSTSIYTVTSCAPTVTNCPVGSVTTDVISLYTTWCPVTATETGTTAATTPYETTVVSTGKPYSTTVTKVSSGEAYTSTYVEVSSGAGFTSTVTKVSSGAAYTSTYVEVSSVAAQTSTYVKPVSSVAGESSLAATHATASTGLPKSATTSPLATVTNGAGRTEVAALVGVAALVAFIL